MKLMIIHDEDGNILSVALANSAGEYRAGLRVEHKELVTEIEVEPAADGELRRHPREFCEKFRVDGVTNRLLPKKR
jgi:hypothetical protein